MYIFKAHNYLHVVPLPTVTVTAPDSQIIGRPLPLQCEVTTVRGITSRVDIVWRRDGAELERMNDVSLTVMGNSLVYTSFYTITLLISTHKDAVILCEAIINTGDLPVMASHNVTLDASSKFTTLQILCSLLGSLICNIHSANITG